MKESMSDKEKNLDDLIFSYITRKKSYFNADDVLEEIIKDKVECNSNLEIDEKNLKSDLMKKLELLLRNRVLQVENGKYINKIQLEV